MCMCVFGWDSVVIYYLYKFVIYIKQRQSKNKHGERRRSAREKLFVQDRGRVSEKFAESIEKG